MGRTGAWIGGAILAIGIAVLVYFIGSREETVRPPREAPTPPTPEKPPPAAAPEPSLPERWRIAVRKNPRSCIQLEVALKADEDRNREPLVRIAREDPHAKVRAFTVSVLGRFRRPPPESFFVARLSDDHEFPRTSAAAALERIGTSACLPDLDRAASGDPAERVREAAARAADAVRRRN